MKTAMIVTVADNWPSYYVFDGDLTRFDEVLIGCEMAADLGFIKEAKELQAILKADEDETDTAMKAQTTRAGFAAAIREGAILIHCGIEDFDFDYSDIEENDAE